MGVFQNNLLAGAAAAASAGGGGFYSHQIEQSLRMSYAEDTQLIRTNGTPSNQKKWTMSYWFKVQDPNSTVQREVQMITAGTSGSAYVFTTLSSGHSAQSFKREYSGLGYLNSEMKFRDSSGWYHFVHRVDTTQSTDSDRERIYINGNEITWLTSQGPNYVSQDSDYGYVTQNSVQIAMGGISGVATGQIGSNVSYAEWILSDGQSYAPTQFGETKNGVWIPKDPSGTTFGDNGFHLKFENASDLGNDSSGNNNDFTVNNIGADHQVLDSPTFGS